jgi:hypothetical protein
MSAQPSAPVTSACKVVAGVEWRSWKVGIGVYEWRDTSGLLRAGKFGLQTFWASVDGKILQTKSGKYHRRAMRFRSLEAAMREAVARAER